MFNFSIKNRKYNMPFVILNLILLIFFMSSERKKEIDNFSNIS